MVVDLWLRRRTATSTRRRPAVVRQADRSLADMPRWLARAKALPDIRWEKVARVRQALDAGGYDLDARLQDMLGHLSEDLAACNRNQL